MGNNVTKTIDKWGINPRKITLKSKKRKDAPVVHRHQTTNAHLYDSVPDAPIYAKVNKRPRSVDEDGLHYADIQVLRPKREQRPPPVSESTEYATIDFKTPPKPSQAADILIPPGALQRPVSKSRRKKSSTSQKGVLV